MTEAHYSSAISFHQVLSCLVVDAAFCPVEGPRIASWTVATLHIDPLVLVGRVLSERPFELEYGPYFKAKTYRLGDKNP